MQNIHLRDYNTKGNSPFKNKELPVATNLLIRSRNLSTVRKQVWLSSLVHVLPTCAGFSTGVADFFFKNEDVLVTQIHVRNKGPQNL